MLRQKFYARSVLIGLVLALCVVALDVPPARAGAIAFSWAGRMGGSSYDRGQSLAVDATGNVYGTGNFSGTADFDPGSGTYNITSLGQADIYVTKLNSSGGLVWAKRMGGTGDEGGSRIVLDANGNLYVIGDFTETADFNPGAGTLNLSSAGLYDVFIFKLDANGNLNWARRLGGTDNDKGYGVAVDQNGNVYVTGSFSGTADFDPGAGLFNLTAIGARDIFISKLNASGNLVWAKNMGGTSDDTGTNLAVDGSGNIYTTGIFSTTVDFDPGANVYALNSVGYGDIFISKLDSNGNFVWAKSMGGTDSDTSEDIQVSNSGYVYSTGSFHNTVDFDPGAGVSNLTSSGYWDFYISKLDADGNYVWARAIGGPLYSDDSYGLALDASENVYTVGGYNGTVDFDPGPGTYSLTSIKAGDIFISKLDSNGDFQWAKSMGGTVYDYGLDIDVDAMGNVYSIGDFFGTADFDPDAGTASMTSAGYNDIFIVALKMLPTFADVPTSHPYWQDIEILYANGLTGGCATGPLKYCPDQIMNRGQAAVFILRANFGPSYVPPAATHIFQDDWAKGPWAEPWAEAMRNKGISAGCLASPLKYCPWDQIPREQAVIFALRMKYGTLYTPPPATGTLFADMTDPSYYATPWAEQAYKDGLIQSCGTSGGKPKFCPKNLVSRGLAAYMIVRAKNLTMP